MYRWLFRLIWIFKSTKALRNFVIVILLICTVYLVYSIISNPFGEQDIMLALAVTAGFVSLDSNKNREKDK